MRRPLGWIIAIAWLAGCSASRQNLEPAWSSRDLMIRGKAIERVVEEKVMARDRLLRGRFLEAPRFFSFADGKGGGYVLMSAAFGTASAMGPRYTWLYHVESEKVKRVFRYPFDATGVEGHEGRPVIKGHYWAYECTRCSDPSAGYMARIPVKVVRRAKGRGWEIIADIPSGERDRFGREARLVVKSAVQKYGRDREARRMLKQISRLIPEGAVVPPVPTPVPPVPLRQPSVSRVGMEPPSWLKEKYQ